MRGLRGIGTVRNHAGDVNCQDPSAGRAAIPTANTPSSNRGVKPRLYSGDAAHRVVAKRQPYGHSKALRLELDRQECLFQVQGEFGPRGNNGRTHSTAVSSAFGSEQLRGPEASAQATSGVDCPLQPRPSTLEPRAGDSGRFEAAIAAAFGRLSHMPSTPVRAD